MSGIMLYQNLVVHTRNSYALSATRTAYGATRTLRRVQYSHRVWWYQQKHFPFVEFMIGIRSVTTANQTQETALPAQIVPISRFFVFDFGLWDPTGTFASTQVLTRGYDGIVIFLVLVLTRDFGVARRVLGPIWLCTRYAIPGTDAGYFGIQHHAL